MPAINGFVASLSSILIPCSSILHRPFSNPSSHTTRSEPIPRRYTSIEGKLLRDIRLETFLKESPNVIEAKETAAAGPSVPHHRVQMGNTLDHIMSKFDRVQDSRPTKTS